MIFHLTTSCFMLSSDVHSCMVKSSGYHRISVYDQSKRRNATSIGALWVWIMIRDYVGWSWHFALWFNHAYCVFAELRMNVCFTVLLVLFCSLVWLEIWKTKWMIESWMKYNPKRLNVAIGWRALENFLLIDSIT